MRQSKSTKRETPGIGLMPFTEPFFLTALLLLGLGWVMVLSASMPIADRTLGNPFYYGQQQAIAIAIGITLGFAAYQCPMALWQKAARPALCLAILALLVVLIPGVGRTVNGSTRWLSLGGLSFQVSEFMKLAWVIYLADYCVRRRDLIQNSAKGFVGPLILVGLISVLLLMEPDFGATVVILATGLGMLFIAGVPFRYFLFALSSGLLVIAALAVSAPYRLQRLTSFLNPWEDQFNSGYQLTQALIAFGRGGWDGVGLGASVQKLFYLPEAHTDFLFAIAAEELGLIGALTIVVLFLTLILRGLIIAYRAQSEERTFASLVAYGIIFWLGLQSFINMGVNLGLLPTKGLTLPLMSYGRSSLMMVCIALGLILRVQREGKEAVSWRQYSYHTIRPMLS